MNAGFECKHFHGEFTIVHVGHYPDLVNISAHVNIEGLDQSILQEDVVYEFPQYEPNLFKYLPFLPKAHSTPHDRMQELVQDIEGLNVDMLQQIVGRAFVKHGLELVNREDHSHEQREPVHNMSYLDQEGILQASKVIVQPLVEKGMLKSTILKLDNFNGDP